jgi:hypothetical protein
MLQANPGGGHIEDVHGLVRDSTRQKSSLTSDLWVVDIGTVLGLAHLILEDEERWLVNSRIDLRTFNDIY